MKWGYFPSTKFLKMITMFYWQRQADSEVKFYWKTLQEKKSFTVSGNEVQQLLI